VGENDVSGVRSTERADVETFTRAEVDAMFAEQAARANRPGIEEGPHLQDPEIRAAKREQMIAAGRTVDDPDITDDMRAILEEAD
jgi:hypothetical protein